MTTDPTPSGQSKPPAPVGEPPREIHLSPDEDDQVLTDGWEGACWSPESMSEQSVRYIRADLVSQGTAPAPAAPGDDEALKALQAADKWFAANYPSIPGGFDNPTWEQVAKAARRLEGAAPVSPGEPPAARPVDPALCGAKSPDSFPRPCLRERGHTGAHEYEDRRILLRWWNQSPGIDEAAQGVTGVGNVG